MLRFFSDNVGRRGKLLLYLVGLAALGGCASTTTPGKSAFVPLGEAAPAPIAFLDFCARQPADCRAPEGAAPVVAPRSRPTGPDRLAPARLIMTASVRGAVRMPELPLSPAVQPMILSERMADIRISLAPGPVALAQVSLPWGPMGQAAPDLGVTGLDDIVISYSMNTPLAAALATDSAPDDVADAAAAPDRAADTPLHLSPGLLARLNQVNQQINRAIKPETDMVTHGVADRWDTPLEDGQAAGDCEDYVLEKHRALLEAGFPAQALSIAVVRTRWGEDHAVLIVTTDGGDLVLDNLSSWVVPWRDLNYTWIERQTPGQPFDWVSVASGSAQQPPASTAAVG